MNGALARSIAALLPDRARGPLAPVAPLAPVLGGVGVASLAAHASPPAPPPSAVFGADHGLLYAPGVGVSEQATVLVYDDLLAYLRSNEIPLAEVCGSSFPNSYGSGNDSSYPSSVWGSAGVGEHNTTPPVAVPHLHSGLGVIWAQGVVGAGRDITTLAGLAYSPKECTVVRSPIGEYWLISTPAGGDWTATRLAIGGGLECAEASIRGGEVDGIAANVLQSLVLGRLVLADPAESVAIAGWDADLAPLFQPSMEYYWATAPSDVWGWGWQWSMQCAGAPDEFIARAILVLLSEVWLSSSSATGRRVCSIECSAVIQWDGDGRPSGVTVTSGPHELFALPNRIIELIGTGGFSLPYTDAVVNGPDIFGSGGKLAAWYKSDATIAYVRWEGMTRYYSQSGNMMSLLGPGEFGAVFDTSRVGEFGGEGTLTVDGIQYHSQHSTSHCTLDVTEHVEYSSTITVTCNEYENNQWVIYPMFEQQRGSGSFIEHEVREITAWLKTFVIVSAPRAVWVITKCLSPRRWVSATFDANVQGTFPVIDTPVAGCPCNPVENPSVYLWPTLYPSWVAAPLGHRRLTFDHPLTTDAAPETVGTLIPGNASEAIGPMPVSVTISSVSNYGGTNVGPVICSATGAVVTAIGGVAVCPSSIPHAMVSDPSGWIWAGGA